jgi:hypothetical protein
MFLPTSARLWPNNRRAFSKFKRGNFEMTGKWRQVRPSRQSHSSLASYYCALKVNFQSLFSHPSTSSSSAYLAFAATTFPHLFCSSRRVYRRLSQHVPFALGFSKVSHCARLRHPPHPGTSRYESLTFSHQSWFSSLCCFVNLFVYLLAISNLPGLRALVDGGVQVPCIAEKSHRSCLATASGTIIIPNN